MSGDPKLNTDKIDPQIIDYIVSKIDRLLWGRRFPLEVIVRTPEEVDYNLKARNPFYLHHIFKEGNSLKKE